MADKTRQSANLVSAGGLASTEGKVGIGTDYPTTKLTVVGIVSATSFATPDGPVGGGLNVFNIIGL